MNALVYNEKKSLSFIQVDRPRIMCPTDAIIQTTATTICGSDLHLYNGEIPKELLKGYTLGHEAVGVVSDIGSDIKNFKVGDRVVISAIVSCGACEFCKKGEMSCCSVTNTSIIQKGLMGHNTAALFGYSDLFGGLNGTQAEYVRVPIADVNLFKIPTEIDDRTALLVSDIACTGYHGCELAEVSEKDTVVVFGCGPVGLMTMMWCKQRKAKHIIAIDIDEQRLNFARDKLDVAVINSKDQDIVKIVLGLNPNGPDKVIDCVGFRFPDNLLHKIQRYVGLETDSPNIVNAAIQMVKKNGIVVLIGDYMGYTNNFNIGALMEKHLTLRGGQLWPHKYQKKIFESLQSGEIDPTFVYTHVYPLSKINEAYDAFDKHEDGMLKCLILPDSICNEKKKLIL